ncbi:MAG: hypothetical protein HFK10_00420 [Clostridia bacterium]|nr:hypothetical protein [Clostridia bacterium]
MKKFLKSSLLVALCLLTVFSFTACSKFGSVKKAFEKEGYTYSEETNDNVNKIKEELKDEEGNAIELTPHVFTKKDGLTGSVIVIILEFKSDKDIDKALEDSETLKGLLKDAQKSDYVNGNCVCIPIGLPTAANNALEIFKKA